MIMCAIAGILGSTGENREVLESMLKTMTRRGPDQWGIFQGKGLSLLHARLAVVDLEGGRQPMELLHKGVHYHMVYNGELYNTEELRRLLVLEGHTFLGHSDTEVVLHAYAQWGDGCVERFNGIFAFAVWEEEPERLFLARDRIGVKPLFYTVRGGQLLFASEPPGPPVGPGSGGRPRRGGGDAPGAWPDSRLRRLPWHPGGGAGVLRLL